MVGSKFSLVYCDGCDISKLELDPPNVVNLPVPWRIVTVRSWGDFHACCDICEKVIRGRYERPEKALIVEPTRPDREDPTIPELPSTVRRAVKVKGPKNGEGR